MAEDGDRGNSTDLSQGSKVVPQCQPAFYRREREVLLDFPALGQLRLACLSFNWDPEFLYSSLGFGAGGGEKEMGHTEEKTSTLRRHTKSGEGRRGDDQTRRRQLGEGERNTRRGDYTEGGLYGEGGEDIQREETGDIHKVPGTNTRGDYKERGLQLA